ncbi:SMP-30/gluconolactonase/LRE family protein [Fimbriiglobus ruber]|uniref:Gluconolactonase n=1 Tax=Fimbriiglobus ruber TaxID=1908690 RepID=A0A225D6B7_9BACT|nr:SMP-30/gluconolactonase/LRE family protein [Fimbriiglobus ruber]OWK36523.1 Gluconolactonase [Fimbriiglobus ruber]
MAATPTTEASVWYSPEREEDRFLLEGPREVVVDGDGAVAWVNIQTAADATTGDIHVRFTDDEDDRFYLTAPARPGFMLPCARPNTVLVGLGKDLRTCDLSAGTWSDPLATIPDANPRTIINDGEIVPGGRAVVFGTKDTKFENTIAELYLYTVDDGKLTVLAGGHVCSNGKVFARDDRGLVLYDIDTPRKVVTKYRLDVDKRTLTEDGIAVDLRGRSDFPDGMCGCGDGTAIIAFYNPALAPAGRAVRYRLDTGELVEEWTTPGSPRVTCPLLVTRDGSVKLILTTATEGMPADMREQCPEAGSLFIADTTITKAPAAEIVQIV